MRILTAVMILAFLTGCNGSDGESDPDLTQYLNEQAQIRDFESLEPFKTSTLDDFNFQGNPEYVEIRSVFSGSEADQFDVIVEFDPEVKSQLSESQLYLLNNTTSTYGYDYACEPESCAYYLVAIEGQDVHLIDNQQDLSQFLGEIDTPHEIHFILKAHTKPTHYKVVGDGYLVMARWFDCNGAQGVDLIHVDRFGNETLQETLVRQSTGSMC